MIAIKIGLKGLSISLTSFVDMLYFVIIRGVVNFMLATGHRRQETPKTSEFIPNNPSSSFIAPSCPKTRQPFVPIFGTNLDVLGFQDQNETYHTSNDGKIQQMNKTC